MPSCTSSARSRSRASTASWLSATWSATLPDDVSERVLVAVDAANESRLGPEHRQLLDEAPLVIDIDHHHDNSRFGDLNLIVADASSTGEILRDLLAELGVDLTPPLPRRSTSRS